MDCQNHCDELNEILTDLRNTLEQANTGKAAQRADRLNKATSQHKKARRQAHSLKVDTRELANQAERKEYNQKQRSYEREIAEIGHKIAELKSAGEEAAAAEAPGQDRARTRVNQRFDQIDALQVSTIKELEGGLRTVTRTQERADDTVKGLKSQTDDLHAVQQELEELEGNVKRARREMQAFMRRMMSDKLILAMMFLVVLGILGMIGFRIAHMHRKGN